MLPGESLQVPTLLALIVATFGTLAACTLSFAYLRRVRVERPAIGTFNGRDIVILFVFIVGLPLLYLAVPLVWLLIFLGITLSSALAIGLRPLLGPSSVWLVVGTLIGLDVWMARTMLGTVLGWQLFWIVNSVLVVAAAVSISNLYAQGGMRLKHVAWITLVLAVYDVVFTVVWPVTNYLAQRLIGYPLDPSVGFRWGIFNATVGIGDLLVYSLFVILSFKAYGRAAAKIAMVTVVIFGVVVPALSPILFRVLIDARTDLIVPAQTAFGPVAFVLYLWFRRRFGRERTMAEFLAGPDVPHPEPTPVLVRNEDAAEPVTAPPLAYLSKPEHNR